MILGNHPYFDRLAFLVQLSAAAISVWWGGLTVVVQALIGLMALDITTGMLAAFVNHQLSSDVSFRGIAKKTIVLLVVAGSTLVEPAVGLPVGQAVAGFYAAHEGLSVVENMARAGLPVPQVLQDALARLSSEQESRQETTNG